MTPPPEIRDAENTEQTLLPCPFCGEAPLEDRIEPHEHSPALVGLIPIRFGYPGSWSIECVHCECRIFSHESREEAVRRWNLRSQPSRPELAAKPAALSEEELRLLNAVIESLLHEGQDGLSEDVRALLTRLSTTGR